MKKVGAKKNMVKSHHVEICVETVTSAVNAEIGGATRLEVCQALSVGGLTPTSGLLRAVKRHVKIPVVCLIRPRPGSFVYSEEEVAIMLDDIQDAIKNGVNGIAIGALTPENTIDTQICRTLIEPALANQIPVTFHRAFDYAQCPRTALQDIITLGCARVLTSGCAKDALTGAALIHDLIEQAGSLTSVIPAGGIIPANVCEIIETSGACEIHGSASIKCNDSAPGDETSATVRLGDSNEFLVKVCSVEIVQQLRSKAELAWGTNLKL